MTKIKKAPTPVARLRTVIREQRRVDRDRRAWVKSVFLALEDGLLGVGIEQLDLMLAEWPER